MPRIVAIVGRPNVGKSRLFNRLARQRISIVHDQPGVTRDVISTEVADGAYTLLDTGGLGLTGSDTPARITKASEEQVHFAITTANVILFAYGTTIGWSYYGEMAWSFLFGRKFILLYYLIFCSATFLGGIMHFGIVLDFSDLLILGMSLPNLVALYVMRRTVREQLRDYRARMGL